MFKNHYELATIIVYCIFFAGIIWAWSQIGKPSLRPGEGDIIAKSKGPFNRLGCRPESKFLTTIVILSDDLDRLYELCLSCLVS